MLKTTANKRRAPLLGLALLAWACLGPNPCFAADKPVNPDKPFAQHFLALQLSDGDPGKAALVLSVANNLLKYYGPDRIDIEVIAFGPGIHLVFAKDPNAKMVDSLVAQGVRFDACQNTLDSIRREQGHVPALNPHASHVQAGVARILKLEEKGYTLVRP